MIRFYFVLSFQVISIDNNFECCLPSNIQLEEKKNLFVIFVLLYWKTTFHFKRFPDETVSLSSLSSWLKCLKSIKLNLS